MKEEENHLTNTQLKVISLQQVCFICMFIFKFGIQLKWQRRMKEEEHYRTNTQLKMTSSEEVCFICMFIFKLSICSCYCELYKMAKKDGKKKKLVE